MKRNYEKIIFAVVYLAYTSIYIARVNLSMATPGLIELNVLNTAQIGILGGAFSTVYSIGRLLNGSLSDSKPPWLMITTGLAIAGLSNIVAGFFPPFLGFFLLWSANAYAQSMLWSSILCIISGMYGKSVAKKKTSVMVTSVAMGNILGIVINSFLILTLGNRFAFVVPGILTIVLGILVFIFTKNIKSPAEQAFASKSHVSFWSLLRNKEISLMSIPAMFHGVMKENITLWMAVYVADIYYVDLSTSSYYILLIPVIGFIGRLLYPLLYKICRNRENNVALIGFMICLIAALVLCFSKIGIIASVLSLSIIYAAVSVINTSLLSIYPLHYLKTGNVASVSGIMDFATYLGGGIASAIYGVVINHFGYLPMFISWALISAISLALILKINKARLKEVA